MGLFTRKKNKTHAKKVIKDRKRKSEIKQSNKAKAKTYQAKKVDKRRKKRKIKIGTIYKTDAQNVYAARKGKKKYVVPVKRNEKDVTAVKMTSIDEKALSESSGKKSKLEKKALLPLKHDYKGLKRKTALENEVHHIKEENIEQYNSIGSKLKTDDLKRAKKHAKEK